MKPSEWTERLYKLLLSGDEDRRLIAVRVPPNVHRSLQILSTLSQTPIQDLVSDAVARAIIEKCVLEEPFSEVLFTGLSQLAGKEPQTKASTAAAEKPAPPTKITLIAPVRIDVPDEEEPSTEAPSGTDQAGETDEGGEDPDAANT